MANQPAVNFNYVNSLLGASGTEATGAETRVITSSLVGTHQGIDVAPIGTLDINIVGTSVNIGGGGGTDVNVASGTQQTLGTVGTIIGVGTLSNIGALPQISVGTIPQVSIGTVPTISLNDYGTNVNIVSGTQQTLGTAGTVIGIGTQTNLGSVTSVGQIHNAGTIAGGTVQADHLITGIVAGVKAVGTSGTPVPLMSSSTPCRKVVLQSSYSNTGYIAVGGTGVVAGTSTTSKGIQLTPGGFFVFQIDNLNDVYIDATINGEHAMFTYFT